MRMRKVSWRLSHCYYPCWKHSHSALLEMLGALSVCTNRTLWRSHGQQPLYSPSIVNSSRTEPGTLNPPSGSSWLASLHFQHVLVETVVTRKYFAGHDNKPERIPSEEMWLQKVRVTMEEKCEQLLRISINFIWWYPVYNHTEFTLPFLVNFFTKFMALPASSYTLNIFFDSITQTE
jgi:hypothetical protein